MLEFTGYGTGRHSPRPPRRYRRMAARLVWLGSVDEIGRLGRRVIVVPHQADAVEDVRHDAGDERDVGRAGAIGADGGHRARARCRGWRDRTRRAAARCPRSAAATDSRPRRSASPSVCASGLSARTAFIVSRACWSCSFDSVRRSPIAIARRGDHVGLAGGRAAAEDLVDLRGRAAEHQARVEGQVRFARQLAAEAVEDPRELVVGAIAEVAAGRSATSARSSPSPRSVQDEVPRRAVTAKLGSPGPSSKPSAYCAPLAASTSAARAAACGSPESSSSPVMTTTRFMPARAPALFSALSAATMIDVAALHVDDAGARRASCGRAS